MDRQRDGMVNQIKQKDLDIKITYA